MKLKIKYYVKFRAFFVTFGTISGERVFDLPIATIPIPLPIFRVDDRGLKIEVTVVNA